MNTIKKIFILLFCMIPIIPNFVYAEDIKTDSVYQTFFLPEKDGFMQPYVGDTMPYYEDGVYYVYYLRDGGDSLNHSIYLVTTTDFITYEEQDQPVLEADMEKTV